jgi:hypothetical protein
MHPYRMRSVGPPLVVAALLALAAPAAARADAVIDWNQHAMDALTAPPPGAAQAPPVAALHMAMVHGAVYDAVNAIDRHYQPYLVAPRARRWHSKDAAAATAAYRVLANIVPGQQARLDEWYAASLAALPPGRAKDGGIAVGDAAAAAMIAARTNDGRFGAPGFPVGDGPGQWRPTPPSLVNDPNAWLAVVKPFLLRSAAQVRTDGPNPLSSRRYAKEFKEVKTLGSASTPTARTPEQDALAAFWSQSPLAMLNPVFRTLSAEHRLGIAANARLMGMLYLTTADAAIGCWNDKAWWLFWRPITAIREAATDGNPATVADTEWLPLLATPPYPDHPSGFNCLTGSFTRTLRDFFGTDRMAFAVTNTGSGVTRAYTRFSDVPAETIDARIYQGIHFRSADEQGAELGKDVARYRTRHYFHPTHRWRR